MNRTTASHHATLGRSSRRGAALKMGPLLVLCAATLSACGSSQSPQAQATNSSGALVAEMLDSNFPATGAQAVNGAKFMVQEQNLEGIVAAKCMAGHGWSVRIPTTSPAAVARAAAFFPADPMFPDLAWMRSHGLFQAPGNLTMGWGMKGPLSDAKSLDLVKCYASVGHPTTAYDRDSRALNTKWVEEVSNVIQASPRVLRANRTFTACLERGGVAPRGAGSLSDFLYTWIYAPLQEASHSHSLGPERRLVTLFVPCATPLVALQERLQKQAQSSFFQTHYAAIKALEQMVPRMMAALARKADSPYNAAGGKV